MEQEEVSSLVLRLTALLCKIDERSVPIVTRLAQHEAHMARLDAMIEEQREWNREQRELNKEQRSINARLIGAIERLDTLITKVCQDRPNGRD